MRPMIALILSCLTLHGLLCVVLAVGCGSPCLQVKTTRCNGSLVELCGSNKKWQRVMDCAEVKAIRPGAPTTWTCAETAKGCICIPKGGK